MRSPGPVSDCRSRFALFAASRRAVERSRALAITGCAGPAMSGLLLT